MTKHYLEHKEEARAIILRRLKYYNEYYGYNYNRVAIRNQRRCWGSCSSKGNLNFSYKLLLLPEDLRDYIVVHELCHLKELNHGKNFWALVAETLPDYKERIKRLKAIERQGMSVKILQEAHSAASQIE